MKLWNLKILNISMKNIAHLVYNKHEYKTNFPLEGGENNKINLARMYIETKILIS